MNKIKKGDIVYNISYENNTLFKVERIIKLHNKEKIAILKGLTERIELDSNIKDLNVVKKEMIKQHLDTLDRKFEDKIDKKNKKLEA